MIIHSIASIKSQFFSLNLNKKVMYSIEAFG